MAGRVNQRVSPCESKATSIGFDSSHSFSLGPPFPSTYLTKGSKGCYRPLHLLESVVDFVRSARSTRALLVSAILCGCRRYYYTPNALGFLNWRCRTGSRRQRYPASTKSHSYPSSYFPRISLREKGLFAFISVQSSVCCPHLPISERPRPPIGPRR